MNEGNAGSQHIFFAQNACGFSNYALYNSDITDKIYCVYTTCIN